MNMLLKSINKEISIKLDCMFEIEEIHNEIADMEYALSRLNKELGEIDEEIRALSILFFCKTGLFPDEVKCG